MELREKAKLMAQNVCIPTGSASLSHAELSACFRSAMASALEGAALLCDAEVVRIGGREAMAAGICAARIREAAERLRTVKP